MTAEIPLIGGIDNRGGIVRVGDTVRRPAKPWSPAVRALLHHLEAVGFDGAPRHLGVDEQGRDIMSFLDGDVPLPPYPSWAMTEEALVALGVLLRRYHAATATFDRSAAAAWAPYWCDPNGGPAVCHNDVFPENVVFRDGLPVALIDFDMAAPGRPLWDLAIAAHEWAPLKAPGAMRNHPPDLDAVRRFGVLARAYGLDTDTATTFVDVVFEERAQAMGHIREELAAGNEAWMKEWGTDGDDRAAADDAWLADHRDALIAIAAHDSAN